MKNDISMYSHNSNDTGSKVLPSNLFTNMYMQKEGKAISNISKLLKESRSPKPIVCKYKKEGLFNFDINDNFDSFINRHNKQKTPTNNNIERINILYNELNRKLNNSKEAIVLKKSNSPKRVNRENSNHNIKVNKFKNDSIINEEHTTKIKEDEHNENKHNNNQRKDITIPRSISIKTINIPKLPTNIFDKENNNINSNKVINTESISECVTNRKRNTNRYFDDTTETKDDISYTIRTEDDIKYKETTLHEIKTIKIIKTPIPESKTITHKPQLSTRQHSPSTCNKHLFKLKQKLQEVVIKYKSKHTHIYPTPCTCTCYSEMHSLLNDLSNIIELN